MYLATEYLATVYLATVYLATVHPQDVPGYPGGRHSRRRPQLSESEDGDAVLGARGAGAVAVRREETFSRNTFPARGKQRQARTAVDAGRSVSVPPKPFTALAQDTSREPSYWGLAHPLDHSVLYPGLASGDTSQVGGATGSQACRNVRSPDSAS